jgi:hypothetical protein
VSNRDDTREIQVMQSQEPESYVPAPPPYQPPTPYEPSPPPERRGCSGCGWLFAGAGGCLLLTGVVIAAAVLLGVISVNNLVGGIGSIFTGGPPPRASVTSTQTLVQGIQPLGQLVSVSTQLAKADIAVGIQQGVLNTCGFSANHVAQGAVEAGIDLTQIEEDDIRFDTVRSVYVVTVPAPQLTSCRVDYIRQYDRSTTACTVDWDEARLLASYTALIDFRDDAVEGGILNRAENETRLVLGNFIKLVTGSSVEIVFDETQQPLPPSCQPALPDGWFQDPATGGWTR